MEEGQLASDETMQWCPPDRLGSLRFGKLRCRKQRSDQVHVPRWQDDRRDDMHWKGIFDTRCSGAVRIYMGEEKKSTTAELLIFLFRPYGKGQGREYSCSFLKRVLSAQYSSLICSQLFLSHSDIFLFCKNGE